MSSNNRPAPHPSPRRHPPPPRPAQAPSPTPQSSKPPAPLHPKNTSDLGVNSSPSSSLNSKPPLPLLSSFNSKPSTSKLLKSTDENNAELEDNPEEQLEQEQLNLDSLPENILEHLFTYLEIGDVYSTSLVCPSFARVLEDENGEVWRCLASRRIDRDLLSGELLTVLPTFKGKLRAWAHAWNPNDTSRNVYVRPSGFTIHRNPVAQSTDGARGKIGFLRGRHAWEVMWEGPLGTVAVVGVATREADLRAPGYIALLGKDEQSWGWNLVENVLLHNGDSHGNYPLVNNAPRYQVGERVRVILDCEDNTLSFEKGDEFLGVAFRGLPQGEALFPAVSAVYGNSEISMVYLGPPLDG